MTVSAALALAKECRTHVHLLEVVRPRGPSLLDESAGRRSPDQVTSDRDWSRVEDLIDAATRRGTDVRVVAYRGDATTVIPAYVQLTKARLLVVGQHYGTSRWRRNASIVNTLSRSAPSPVLILPPQLGSQKGKSLAFGHVVSAVDFTVASAVAVRTALDLIRRNGARLTLVHALKNGPNRMVLSGGEALRAARDLPVQAAQVEVRLRRKIPAEARIRVDVRVTAGDPHRRILDIASEVNADLIIMGVPPRSRFDEVMSGSTLRSVLRRAKIPVLVLPVPAGAHRLEETDRVEVAVRARTPTRVRRRLGPS